MSNSNSNSNTNINPDSVPNIIRMDRPQPNNMGGRLLSSQSSGSTSTNANSLPSKVLANAQRMLWSAVQFPRQLFGGYWGREHKLYEVFGWDKAISSQMCWEMYQRGGIARRLIDAYPETVWGNPPVIQSTTAFKNKWQSLVEDQKIWSVLRNVDRLCRLGQYAIIVIGVPGSNLATPLTGGVSEITYLQPYSDRAARISKWGTDFQDPRFNQPVEYRIYPGLVMQETMQPGTTTAMPTTMSYPVHWTRVIHICRSQLENRVYGLPDYWDVWNYLTDLQKVVGGSAESYWNTANRGINANVNPEIDMTEEDELNLTAEVQEYFEGQRRFIRSRGVDIKSLGSDVADPSGPYGTLIDLIAGTKGIPQRVLVGSEAAHQASTQDRQTWAERVQYERTNFTEPYILYPTIEALQRIGYLPKPKSRPIANWPSAYILSPLEVDQATNQRATAINNLALAMRNIENLMTIEEARTIANINTGMDATSPGAIVSGTIPVVPAGNSVVPGHGENAPTVDPGSDGGIAKAGPDSGNTTGAGNTDSNGQGAAPAKRGKR